METKEKTHAGYKYNVTKYTGRKINNTQVELKLSLIKEKFMFQ